MPAVADTFGEVRLIQTNQEELSESDEESYGESDLDGLSEFGEDGKSSYGCHGGFFDDDFGGLFDAPPITAHFRKVHGIPQSIPSDVSDLLAGRLALPDHEPEPEIVYAAARGDLLRVRELVRVAESAPADLDSDSEGEDSPGKRPCARRALRSQAPRDGAEGGPDVARCKEAPSEEGEESEEDSLDESEDEEDEFDSAKDYIIAMNDFEGPGPRWDPVRIQKTPKQLETIRSVEWAIQEATYGMESDFERLVLEVVISLVEGNGEMSVESIVAGLGMKIGEFVLDRLQRAAALGLQEFDAFRLCRRMRERWEHQETKAARRRAEAEHLESLPADQRTARLAQKAAAKAKQAEEQRKTRVALAVNAARRWLETEEKFGGYTKEWEWFGDTALIAAARRGHWEVVRFLLRDCLADPTLQSCPRCDCYETALGPTDDSSKLGLPMQRSGGPTRQRVVERLVGAALPFWKDGPYKSAHYSRQRPGRLRRDGPTDVAALRAALDAADFGDADRLALEREAAEAAAAKAAELAAEAARAAAQAAKVAAKRRQTNPAWCALGGCGQGGPGAYRRCRCGQTNAVGCPHQCCGQCCPGDGCPRHWAKRRRLDATWMFARLGA